MPEMKQDRLALDRASARTFDDAGHLTVIGSTLSLANVCDYLGREIPDYAKLGLDPNRTYKLYRDADALKAAASSGNGKPLLATHRPQTAEDHDADIVVGSINNLTWDAPALKGDLSVWVKEGIDLIESGEQRDLSLGYFYVPVMESGVAPDGTAYDGKMTSISVNHCALVSEGRVRGAFVGDSKPPTKRKFAPMAQHATALSRKGLLTLGALSTLLPPKMATDAKMPDLTKVIGKFEDKHWKAHVPKIKARLTKATEGKLAQDADLEEIIDAAVALVDATTTEEPVTDMDPDDGTVMDSDEEMLAKLKAAFPGMSDEQLAAMCAAAKPKAAADADGPEKGKDLPKPGGAVDADKGKDEPEKVTKAAMDAAIKLAKRDAEAATMTRLNAIYDARQDVRPWVGELVMAQDSAEAVYRTALDTLGVDTAGVPGDALPFILKAQPKPGDERTTKKPPLGLDAASAEGFHKRYPNAQPLRTL